MARNPITSGERRGLAALAAITLAVALAGVFWKGCSCGGNSVKDAGSPPTVVTITDSTAVSEDSCYSDDYENDYGSDASYYRSKHIKSKKRKRNHSSKKDSSAGRNRSEWIPRNMLEDTVK